MLARNDGIAILVVGVGSAVNDRELQGMASAPPDRNIFRSVSFDVLSQNLAKSLGAAVCKS